MTDPFQKLHRKVNQAASLVSGIFAYQISSRLRPLPPAAMIINLTYQCNSRCIMCNIWRRHPQNEMSYQEWSRLMNDPVFEHIRALTLSGGEACLHPELVKLTGLFLRSMPKLKSVNLITNGLLPDLVLDRVKQLERLCRVKQIHLSVSVSLDGLTEKHQEIRRIPDAFQKTSATLKLLQRFSRNKNMSVGIGSLILKQNLDQVNQIQAWADRHHLPVGFQLVGFHETFVNNLGSETEIDYTDTQRDRLVGLLESFSRRSSRPRTHAYYWKDMANVYRTRAPRTTPCPFLYDEFVVDSFGDVFYCLSEPSIGNARQGRSVGQIYFNPVNLQKRHALKQTACRHCNSGCNVDGALSKELFHYLWFLFTGSPYYGQPSRA